MTTTLAGQLADTLWEAALAGDDHAATDAALAALDAGTPVETLLMDVVAPVQSRIGHGWAANELTVVQEHTATAINERVIAAVTSHPAARAQRHEPRPGRITVACIDGEWHALPARLLAEMLRLHGWQVDYLGAQVPARHLVTHLHRTGPDLVALSSSIATRLPTAHATVTACQATGTPVLVGGAAYGSDGRYARRLGADAWAPDARTACAELAKGFPARTHEPLDELPHLADQEYTLVSRSAPQLVRSTMNDLEGRYPAMRDYTDQQRHRTAEDIAHILDFLATALYLDEPTLFSDFLTWTATILTARSVPAESLLPALDLLTERLTDFPRAQAILAHGRAAVHGA